MSHALSILKSNLKNDVWIYNNFLQIFSVEKQEEHVIDFFDFNIENTPFLDFNTMDKKWILECLSVHDFIKSMIEQDCYIICFVNTEYVPAYGYVPGSHDPMIYGYDDIEQVYYLCDHIKGGKYTEFICSYIDLEKAILKVNKIPDRFALRNRKEVDLFRSVNFDENWHRNKLYIYCDHTNRNGIYYEKMIGSLKDYLNATNTVMWGNRMDFMSNTEKKHHNFGVNCFRDLYAHIDRMWDTKAYSNDSIQAVYVFYSYVALMVQRLEKMQIETQYISMWRDLCVDFEKFLMRFLLEVQRCRYTQKAKLELIQYIAKLQDTQIKLMEKTLKKIE